MSRFIFVFSLFCVFTLEVAAQEALPISELDWAEIMELDDLEAQIKFQFPPATKWSPSGLSEYEARVKDLFDRYGRLIRATRSQSRGVSFLTERLRQIVQSEDIVFELLPRLIQRQILLTVFSSEKVIEPEIAQTLRQIDFLEIFNESARYTFPFHAIKFQIHSLSPHAVALDLYRRLQLPFDVLSKAENYTKALVAAQRAFQNKQDISGHLVALEILKIVPVSFFDGAIDLQIDSKKTVGANIVSRKIREARRFSLKENSIGCGSWLRRLVRI